MKNLVLIGMPGCGKTKVGKELSKRLHMPAVDTDQMIVEAAGRSIPEIFSGDGEAVFRDMETAAVRKAAAMSGTVIATGGGVVLRSENMEALRENGVIFFRDRAIEDIAGEEHSGRPLIGSDSEKLYKLYTERISLYKKYAQHTISDTKTVEEAAKLIAAIFLEECSP